MSSFQNKIQHLAMIMDGNRRWATERGLPKMLGHTEGAKNLKKVAKAVKKAGIPYLTLYTLSTENLTGRSAEELKHIFSLLEELTDYLRDFQKENTRLFLIGDITALPESTKNKLLDFQEKTKDNTGFTMTLAINYGGHDEITRAIRKIVAEKIPADKITPDTVEKYLDTANIPPVDLVIRTGGDQRLSNYLPWQTAYAELYFTPVYWPALSEEDLQTALDWFQEQKRNKGK